jgi:hypothetical protein
MKMNRRQLFLSTAKAALAAALGGSWLPGKAKAQTGGSVPDVPGEDVIQGDPERATGTINIDGRYRRRRSAASSGKAPGNPRPGGRRASCRPRAHPMSCSS